jgi:hypothetical protein
MGECLAAKTRPIYYTSIMTQQGIAEDLMAHIKSVEHLRTELQKGIDSLERGEGQELDIEEVIRTARTRMLK